jgi:putative FmdB family regulatory protein
MGIYEFECPCGKITEKLVPLSERPAQIPCPCGTFEASYVISATPTTFRANDRKAFKKRGH